MGTNNNSPETQEIMMRKSLQIKFGLALLIIVLLPAAALAASVTLRWQANQEPDISSYNVYFGTQSRNYGLPIPAGNTTSYTVDNLTAGTTYYFALTAVDTSGNESGYSSEVVANATSSEPATEDYQLLLSTNSNRSNAVKLDGQTISGDVYIFLNPEANVSQVVFSIDGQTHNTENYAPYDLGVPFDSASLSNGSHTISALVRLQDGTSDTVSANCMVENSTSNNPPPATPSDPPSSVALTASVASPQAAGGSVTFSAAVQGQGSYEYRFWRQRPAGSGNWQIVRDYATGSQWTWTTAAGDAGTNRIVVHVRRIGSDDRYEVYDRMDFRISQ